MCFQVVDGELLGIHVMDSSIKKFQVQFKANHSNCRIARSINLISLKFINYCDLTPAHPPQSYKQQELNFAHNQTGACNRE